MRFSKPNIGEAEALAAYQAVKDGHLVTGVLATKFENKFKEKWGYENVVAVNSGTSAMMLALMAKGIGRGDEVIVTPYTMVASVNVVLAVGATPVFADIERDTYNLSAESVAKVWSAKTKAVIPVDLYGVPCDIEAIRAAAPNAFILEDSIEALGSTHNGKPIGYGADAGAFGFFPNKQITTCEGGVLYSKDVELIDRVRHLCRHGVMSGDMNDQAFGYNMRLSDVHAAIGLVQLERFDELQHAMREARRKLDVYFYTIRPQAPRNNDTASEFIYPIELPEHVDKQDFVDCMQERGIPIKQYFVGLHQLPHLAPYYNGGLDVANVVAARTVALPMHYELTNDDAHRIHTAYMEVCYG